MKITFKQNRYNDVELTLSLEELDTILDIIGEDQIENVSVTIKKPAEVENEIQD
jgi:hypothetical protein